MLNQTILDNIAKKLELRQPNKEAVQAFLNHYYNSEKLSEYILSVATGVGKTYIIAAILNYLADAEKITNFLIVAPGKIIREKTINNFSLNKPNSLADKLTIKPPHIIDIKNFHTVKTTDKNSAKLFIFTVQSLTQAKGKTARKTSNYDEILGKSLREHFSKLDDLVIFADEHHLYYGEKFSEAIRELKPKILIGLTGTPHEKTPTNEIIFEYPLWKALRDKLIKIPVMVGRYDGYQDEETKLKDAIKLLEAKQILLNKYTQQNSLKSQKALMLLIAPIIEEAENIRTSLIVNCEFPHENILQIDSSKITDDLAQELQNIDNPHNPARIIIAVGMLKEEALNTLEIIMHDNFKELLDVRKSLKNKLFGLVDEGQTDGSKTVDKWPENSVSQPPQDGTENNSNQNVFNPQSLDEREKDILQQSQENAEDEEFTIEATQQLPKEEKIRRKLIQIIFRKCSFINSANSVEIDSANRLIDKFLQASNLEIVSQYWEAAGEQLARLIQTIFKELHVGENQPEQEVIEKSFGYYHPICETIAENLEEEFVKRTKGYQFTKSLYNYDIFDSGIEFQFAGLIDKAKEIKK
nr:13486_t:CDS:2 [Entrophospora candida]